MSNAETYYAIDRTNSRSGQKLPSLYTETRTEADDRVKTWCMARIGNVATVRQLPDAVHKVIGTYAYNADAYAIQEVTA
jgi:hypothetical protein